MPKIIVASAVLEIASSHREDGAVGTLCFGTEQSPLTGKQCQIYAVQFPDKTVWAVRIPTYASHLEPEALASMIEHEALILKRLEECGFAWSPRLIGHDSGFSNAISFPYLVLNWVHGTPLQWTSSLPPCREIRDKLLYQISLIFVNLAECSQTSETDTDAVTYLTDIIDRKIIRILNNSLPGIELESCFLQRALVRKTFGTTAGNGQEPMLISHEDTSPSNIIVDEDFNVKGLIDWGFARLLPWQLAISLPRFMNIDCEQLDKLSSTRGIAALLQSSTTLQTDRQQFISYVVAAETDARFQATLSTRISFLSVFSSPHLDWRQLLVESVSSKGVHSWMNQRRWLLLANSQTPIDLDMSSLRSILCEEMDLCADQIQVKEGVVLERTRMRDAIDKLLLGFNMTENPPE